MLSGIDPEIRKFRERVLRTLCKKISKKNSPEKKKQKIKTDKNLSCVNSDRASGISP